MNHVRIVSNEFTHSLAQHRPDQDVGIQNDRLVAHATEGVDFFGAFARFVRRICDQCKVDTTGEVPSKTLIDFGFTPDQIGTFQIFKGRGCTSCNGTGYKGLVGLFEVMEITEGIRDLIMVGATAVEIKRKALEEGMLTLRMSGLEKIKQGITTIGEVLRETVL